MSEAHYIPQHLDEPFKLILWTVDELIALFAPIIILGGIFNSLLAGVGIGIILLLAFKKIKGEEGHYYLYNVIYWYFPKMFAFRCTPPSYIREWIG